MRLAEGLGGEVVTTEAGAIVRRESVPLWLPVDRARLATLPGQPPADVPLVCLDTETTGLATAAGTMAFCVGLGWWEGDRIRRVQLLLPDQSDEPALLAALAGLIAPEAWLVTYNGRGFDWPLLVTRFRMLSSPPPRHAGHLDLLPLVRRVFRHRMTNARLRTVEQELLGLTRAEDVEGWEIPGRYIEFLRGGPATLLADVVRHNDEDVVSLARVLAHVEHGFGDAEVRSSAHHGDLAGFARAFARERRLEEALACLDSALARAEMLRDPFGRSQAVPTDDLDDGWWLPRRWPDFGGRPRLGDRLRTSLEAPSRQPDPWTSDRIAVERARLLRRLGRFGEAVAAWETIAAGGGPRGILAWIEVAKLREHRLGHLAEAFEAVRRAWLLVQRSRRLGRPQPAAEADLVERGRRLRARLDRAPQPRVAPTGTRGSGSIVPHSSRTQSSSGSNEQAIVRRSPARALR
jgi:RNase H-like protein